VCVRVCVQQQVCVSGTRSHRLCPTRLVLGACARVACTASAPHLIAAGQQLALRIKQRVLFTFPQRLLGCCRKVAAVHAVCVLAGVCHRPCCSCAWLRKVAQGRESGCLSHLQPSQECQEDAEEAAL
jgi:hypothetical protein